MLVLQQAAWSGGHLLQLTVRVLRSGHAGLMIDSHLALMVPLTMYWVTRPGLKLGKVEQTRVVRLLLLMMGQRQLPLFMMKLLPL